jgi:hypothetical protein
LDAESVCSFEMVLQSQSKVESSYIERVSYREHMGYGIYIHTHKRCEKHFAK